VPIRNGDNDLQVAPDNAEALAEAQPRADKRIVRGMTHELKSSAETTLEGQIRTVYADPSLPLDSAFAAAVTEFIGGL